VSPLGAAGLLYRITGYRDRQFLYSGVTDRIIPIDPETAALVLRATDEDLVAFEGQTLSDIAARESRASEDSREAWREHYRRAIRSGVQQVVLGVTESCNLRCAYCIYSGSYENVRTHGDAQMDWPTARSAIDLLLDHCGNSPVPPGITFYGGEPLLESRLIERCIAYARERNPRVFFTLTTNGLLLNKRNRAWLVENDVFITVSLDGPAEVHDRYRRTQGGKPTFDVIRRNLGALRREAPDYHATRVRFSAVLAPPVDPKRIAEFFDRENHVVVTSPLDLHRMSAVWSAKPQPAQFDYLAEQFIAFCRRRRAGEAVDPSRHFAVCSLGPALRRIQARRQGLYGDPYRLGQCIVGSRKIFVSPAGRLYPCEKVEGGADVEIGDVDRGVNLDKVEALMRRFRNIVAERCGGCWMRHMCTGCLMQTVHGGAFDSEKMDHACRARRQGQADIVGLYGYLISEAPDSLDFLPEILPNG